MSDGPNCPEVEDREQWSVGAVLGWEGGPGSQELAG